MRRVAAANPNTIVVVNAGAPVLMPWVQDVAAVLLAWFPGQEFGNALADVLLGRGRTRAAAYRRPGPRPRRACLPPVRSTASCAYDEGLIGRLPRTPRRADRDAVPVRARPRVLVLGVRVDRRAGRARAGRGGTRDRRGSEHRAAAQPRGRPGLREPPRQRASSGRSGGSSALRRCSAEPGRAATATIIVPPRAFEHWSVAGGRWAAKPGTFELAAGSVARRKLPAV